MKILLTGDDGYNSIGIRMLISILKFSHELTIVATKTQQSGVGGKLSLHGGSWGETTIDGVQAFCIDGTPGDCAEFSYARFQKKFDYVLSGVNMGENISTAIISSGTVSAAHRCLGLQVAQKAIALSWMTPPDHYLRTHDEKEDIQKYLDNPGKMVEHVLLDIFGTNAYACDFLNVNFPRKHTTEKVFTKLEESIRSCYPPINVDDHDMTFSYPIINGDNSSINSTSDIVVLRSGRISITPLQLNWTNQEDYDRLK